MTRGNGLPIDDLLRENTAINELLRELAELGLSTLHRPIEHLGTLLSRPIFVLVALGAFLLWIVVNLELKFSGHVPWDEPPFSWLQGLVTLLGLTATITVVVNQARQGQLAEQRAQLQLQIVLLTEQRSAKIIALLEELRRDLPGVHNRLDIEAEVMVRPAAPMPFWRP